jgi:hypothetical protein
VTGVVYDFGSEDKGEYAAFARLPEALSANSVGPGKFPTNQGDSPSVTEGVVLVEDEVIREVSIKGGGVRAAQPAFLQAENITLRKQAIDAGKNTHPPGSPFRVSTINRERASIPGGDPGMGNPERGDRWEIGILPVLGAGSH